MEITRTIIGTYAEITSLAEDSLNKKIGFKWYEPHPNGLEGYFYAILRVESIKGTILENPQISVEELKDFSYGSSITKPISLVEQRKQYNKLLYQFIDEQKAYIEAELKEIALKNGLNFGRSIIETASCERFLLAEMHVLIALICWITIIFDCLAILLGKEKIVVSIVINVALSHLSSLIFVE